MASSPQRPMNSLGDFEWLDNIRCGREWFSEWLCGTWQQIYRDSLTKLLATNPAAFSGAIDGMQTALLKLAEKRVALVTAEQIREVDAVARRFGLQTTRERIESELKFSLRHENKYSPVFKASPWSNTKALEKLNREDAGLELCHKHYPRDPDLQFALRHFMAIISVGEIRDGELRQRRNQKALFLAVRSLITPAGGSKKLAAGLANFLRFKWPKYPEPIVFVGNPAKFDPREHFNLNFRSHTFPYRGMLKKSDRAEHVLVRALITREELWGPLLLLAEDAVHRREGWQHLRNALASVFTHLARLPSVQRRITNAMIHGWPEVRKMLEQKQVASLASKLKSDLRLATSPRDAAALEGKSTVEVQIRRARKPLKQDYDLD